MGKNGPTAKNLKKKTTLVKRIETDWSLSFSSQKEKKENRVVHLFQPLPPSSCSLMTFLNPSSAHGLLLHAFKELCEPQRGQEGAWTAFIWRGEGLSARMRHRGTVCSWTGCGHLLPFYFLYPCGPLCSPCLPRPCCCSRLVPGLTLLLNSESGRDTLPEQGCSVQVSILKLLVPGLGQSRRSISAL